MKLILRFFLFIIFINFNNNIFIVKSIRIIFKVTIFLFIYIEIY